MEVGVLFVEVGIQWRSISSNGDERGGWQTQNGGLEAPLWHSR